MSVCGTMRSFYRFLQLVLVAEVRGVDRSRLGIGHSDMCFYYSLFGHLVWYDVLTPV